MSSETVIGKAAISAQLETVRSMAEANIDEHPPPVSSTATEAKHWNRDADGSFMMLQAMLYYWYNASIGTSDVMPPRGFWWWLVIVKRRRLSFAATRVDETQTFRIVFR